MFGPILTGTEDLTTVITNDPSRFALLELIPAIGTGQFIIMLHLSQR